MAIAIRAGIGKHRNCPVITMEANVQHLCCPQYPHFGCALSVRVLPLPVAVIPNCRRLLPSRLLRKLLFVQCSREFLCGCDWQALTFIGRNAVHMALSVMHSFRDADPYQTKRANINLHVSLATDAGTIAAQGELAQMSSAQIASKLIAHTLAPSSL